MTVFITGGFGYLGGRLAQFLSDAGYEILLGSRRPAQTPQWLPEARTVQTHWDSLSGLTQILAGVDSIVHLAGMNAQSCAANPTAALESNALGTARLLEGAIRQGVKRFIYMSTAHVYGSPITGVITEETCPVSLHPYATSHRAGEDVVRAAHQRGDIAGIAIRLSNAYGAPAHKDADCWMLLVNDLCRQAVTNRRMELRTSGLQRRNFVPIRDACGAVDHLLRLRLEDLANGIFNVGGEWSPTVWEVACQLQERCSAVLGFEPAITKHPPQAAEVAAELEYGVERLRRTGFQSSASRTDEIDRLFRFCKATFTQ